MSRLQQEKKLKTMEEVPTFVLRGEVNVFGQLDNLRKL